MQGAREPVTHDPSLSCSLPLGLQPSRAQRGRESVCKQGGCQEGARVCGEDEKEWGGGHQVDEDWLGFLSDLPHPAVLMQACAHKVEWPANCRGLPVSSSSGQDFF